METELEKAEWAPSGYDQLNLIEEKRLIALFHGQCYQKRMDRAYDKKIKPETSKKVSWSFKRFFHSKMTPKEN